MDESGGSGRPRSGTGEATEGHQRPGATAGPAADAPRPGPAGPEPSTGPAPTAPDPETSADPVPAAPGTSDGTAPAAPETGTASDGPAPVTPAPAAPGSETSAGSAPKAAGSEASSGPAPAAPGSGSEGEPVDGGAASDRPEDSAPRPDSGQSPETAGRGVDADAPAPGPTGAGPRDTPATHTRSRSEADEDPATRSRPASGTGDAEGASPAPAHPHHGHRTPADTGHPAGTPADHTEHRTPADTGHPAGAPADHTEHRTLAHSGNTGGPGGGGDTTGGGGRAGRPPRRRKEPGGGLLMGRPFGVPVYVAPSWFLVAALITWVFGGQLDRVLPELGAARYLVSLFFAVAFYASVLVHELAHTVAALRFKLPVRRIQLQFFGGVSEIEKEAETPGREFVLAFVGPLLSLVLSGVFYLAMLPVEPGTVPGVLLAGLMISNLIVAAFNLLPGLPLDGGRMLRAVVWKITGKPMSGTVAAAWVGRALAVSVLIGLPLLTQSSALGASPEDLSGMDTVTDALLAAILAAIIWTGAGNSLRMARLREHLPELRARSLTRRAVPVETSTPLSEALRRANDAGARALVVVDPDGEPLSLVREAAIVGVPEHRRPWVAVSGLAQDLTDGMRVSAELAGEELLDVLRATPATEYLVVEDSGEIYGVLSAADVERAFVKAMARPA
ncbi:site-2 protease family protein [Streptomyces sp. NPDC007084]|uniref:site-2 protease family protein n=1 Tax=Streptomyces sp. NPDC007084 TaxID=3154313 RepID=UPI00345662D0